MDNTGLASQSYKNRYIAPFEERIVNANKYPVLKNKDGSISTHSMAWEDDRVSGTAIVYPTVVLDKDAGGLVRLGSQEAYDFALATGNYRRFQNRNEAGAWASGGYKQLFPQDFREKYKINTN